MTAEELKERLDELSWQEQMEFEMSERDVQVSDTMMRDLESNIRELAKHVTPTLLDALEHEAGYLVWALRLSRFVHGDNPAVRGRRYLRHQDSAVRYWARTIAGKPPS
jgi:hypothetical protein